MNRSILVKCPVCQSPDNERCNEFPANMDGIGFNCDSCGRFIVTRTALADLSAGGYLKLGLKARTWMSHQLRLKNDDKPNEIPKIFSSNIYQLKDADPELADPETQISRIIVEVGQQYLEDGQNLSLDRTTRSRVGSVNLDQTIQNADLAVAEGYLTTDHMQKELVSKNPVGGYRLTLNGWKRYKEVKKGKAFGSLAFIAMKFGDPELESFVDATLKPLVASVGYSLVDVRDVAQAGIIDNIMRQQIAESEFVVVDLTHDNSGAYWEAGYAEGLGKPVIYICKQEKFSQSATHFDTNHCTTVMWDPSKVDLFTQQFEATLRRTLKLF